MSQTDNATIEDAIVLEETIKPKEQEEKLQDPAEVAATMYTLYLPRFLGLVDTMSNKQLKRLVKALIETPLVETNPKFKTDVEKTAFAIGDQLFQAKTALVISTLFGEQAMQELEQSLSKSEEKKEEKNE